MNRPVITLLKQTCEVAPAQWEGMTADGRPVYIRGRRGHLFARIGPAGGSILDAVAGTEFAIVPHVEADVLSSEEIICLLADILDFSRLEKVENGLDEDISDSFSL